MHRLFPPSIQSAIDAGHILLTPNERIARTLRHAHNLSQATLGLTAWTPPEILSVETWLNTLWTQLLLDGSETRLLLNPLQEHTLWRNIVEADRDLPALRSLVASGADALAQLAAHAYHLLHRFNGAPRLREFAVSTDTRAFARWAQQFDRLCQREAYLSPAQLPAALLLSRSATKESSSRLSLVDFDSIPPALTSLLTSLGPLHHLTSRITPDDSALHRASDPAAELRTAAQWAADLLRQNPAASIAIVVPSLADQRARLDRIFYPLVGPDAYEFSLGAPLADATLVATALDLLRWPLELLPLDTISALLLSPFLPTPAEALAAAEFDAFDLRRAPLLRPELTLDAFQTLLARARRSERLPALRTSIANLRRAAGSEYMQAGQMAGDGPRQSHAGWAWAFRNVLTAANWAAQPNPDSLTFQTRRAFDAALDSLATLDFDGSLVPVSSALLALTRICRETTFAPQSRNAPIQILGPLEPGGIPFDALWFLSADDRTWPPSLAANPMIPWHIQRDLGIPAADPARDAAIAQILTSRLSQSASHVVFSHALHNDDGHLRPSPLLRDLNLYPIPDGLADMAGANPTLALDLIPDTEPLPPIPPGLTPGGSRVLELQAACSFRAFAEIRLHATQPDSPSLGLDARDRGIQVHRILQDFWAQVQSQENLAALSPSDRTAILLPCIARHLGPSSLDPWDIAYLEVQRVRLLNLLTPWLELELTRPPFHVLQQEQKRLAHIGPLTLELRADRIDETSAGLLILDYKTGPASPSDWNSDRPDAPQLPLYAVLASNLANPDQPIPVIPTVIPGPAPTPVAGLAFALLRPGEQLGLQGLTESPEVLAKSSRLHFPSLAEQIDDWHRVLTQLAQDFATNQPTPSPKQYPKTCDRCTQRMFCRLDLTTLDAPTEDEEEPALV